MKESTRRIHQKITFSKKGHPWQLRKYKSSRICYGQVMTVRSKVIHVDICRDCASYRVYKDLLKRKR